MKWLWWALLLLFCIVCLTEFFFLFLLLFDKGNAFPNTEDRRTGAWVVLGLGLFLLALWALLRGMWIKMVRGTTATHLDPRLERKILAYARKSGGRLTVAEVALNARCTVQEADLALQELAKQGVATVLYTPNLEPVYVISGFDEQAQAQARDILNTPSDGKGP